MTDQTLLQQITDFCRLLRQMGVNVTTTNQLSWCESVQLIDIGEREAFYHTARTNLIAGEAERETFDTAFNLFWRYPRPEFQTVDTEEQTAEPSSLQDLSDAGDEQDIVDQWLDTETEDNEEGQEDDPVAYSAEDLLSRKDFSEFTREDMEKAREIVAKVGGSAGDKTQPSKGCRKKGENYRFPTKLATKPRARRRTP